MQTDTPEMVAALPALVKELSVTAVTAATRGSTYNPDGDVFNRADVILHETIGARQIAAGGASFGDNAASMINDPSNQDLGTAAYNGPPTTPDFNMS